MQHTLQQPPLKVACRLHARSGLPAQTVGPWAHLSGREARVQFKVDGGKVHLAQAHGAGPGGGGRGRGSVQGQGAAGREAGRQGEERVAGLKRRCLPGRPAEPRHGRAL